jgi:hypothetical protein
VRGDGRRMGWGMKRRTAEGYCIHPYTRFGTKRCVDVKGRLGVIMHFAAHDYGNQWISEKGAAMKTRAKGNIIHHVY